MIENDLMNTMIINKVIACLSRIKIVQEKNHS